MLREALALGDIAAVEEDVANALRQDCES